MDNIKYQPRTIDILSFTYTLGYFSVLAIAFFHPFPDSNKDVLNVLLGVLSMTMVKIVEAYFNKDSSNSATATTIRAMNNPPTSEAMGAAQVKLDTK